MEWKLGFGFMGKKETIEMSFRAIMDDEKQSYYCLQVLGIFKKINHVQSVKCKPLTPVFCSLLSC